MRRSTIARLVAPRLDLSDPVEAELHARYVAAVQRRRGQEWLRRMLIRGSEELEGGFGTALTAPAAPLPSPAPPVPPVPPPIPQRSPAPAPSQPKPRRPAEVRAGVETETLTEVPSDKRTALQQLKVMMGDDA